MSLDLDRAREEVLVKVWPHPWLPLRCLSSALSCSVVRYVVRGMRSLSFLKLLPGLWSVSFLPLDSCGSYNSLESLSDS